jgi:hypothetical protein
MVWLQIRGHEDSTWEWRIEGAASDYATAKAREKQTYFQIPRHSGRAASVVGRLMTVLPGCRYASYRFRLVALRCGDGGGDASATPGRGIDNEVPADG